MLCTVCSSIDLDALASKKTLEHHKSIKDLDTAARNGCDLCGGLSELYRELLGLQGDVGEHGETGRRDKGYEWWQRDWGQILFEVEGLGQAGGYPLKNDVVFWQPEGSGERDGLYVKLACCTTRGKLLRGAFEAEFQSLQLADDPLSPLIRSRAIPKSSRSTEAFSTISSWLEECLKEHPQCKPQTKNLPTRLISISQLTSETRLVVSDGSLGEWVVLSHCWGTNRHGITTTSNIEARQKMLDLETLPQMFRDAVEITRKLGFQYLWIDSLCIIQDSRLDWQLESMKMDQYFMGASLNISASASSATDATKGIFFTADEGRENFHPVAVMPAYSASTAVGGMIYFRPTEAWGPQQLSGPVSKGKDSPLRRRAWVLQESQLSPRILWFDSKMIRWDCAVAMKSESKQHDGAFLSIMATKFLHRPINDGKVEKLRQRQDALGWWYWTVNDYMTREIKFQNDRVPGLAGLAKAFASRTGFKYICGLWKEDLPRGLFWNACRSKLPTEAAELSNGPPSWSWVSLPTLNTKLVLFAEDERDVIYDAELVEFNVNHVDDNIYGLIESASLTLRGRWQRCHDLEEPYFNTRDNCKVLFPQDIEERRKTYEERTRLQEKQHSRGVVATLDAPEGGHRHSLHPNAIYLQLGKQKRPPTSWHLYGEEPLWVFQALILEPIEGKAEEHQRVGVAEIRVDLAEGDEWTTKTVRII